MTNSTSNSGYTLTIKVANSFAGNGGAIPHAFVTISGPSLAAPVTEGYYPKVTGVSGAGTVRNDAQSHYNSATDTNEPHPYDQSLTFNVSAQQALNALNFAASTANSPGQYQLLGASDKNNLLMQEGYQCTGFARDVARAAGIIPQAVNTGADETIYPSTLGGSGVGTAPTNIASYPGSLMREFGGLDSNQVHPFRSTPDAQAFLQAQGSLYSAIAAYDPVDQSGISARIKPVGEVVVASDGDASFTTLNPDAGTPNAPDKPTVFNPATVLPNYSGDNAITIQPGDTVSSIAKRYDMTEQEFSSYLKDQYGPNADLNSIVAGNKLPLPPAVYERTVGGINGLDLPVDTAPALAGATPTTTPETSDFQDALLDAFSNADQAAADLKAQYPGVQVADAGGGLPGTTAQNNTNTNSFSNFLDTQGSNLTPAQQTALAAQVNSLGLGGEGDLSFYSLPGGGALIANADGDIVGEVNLNSATGSLNLRATGIDADGNAVEVSNHIQQNGAALTEGQYNAQAQQQVANMFNSLMAVNNWDDLSGLGKLSALANLYNAVDKLGEAFNATGNNLPGDLGAAAGWLSLAQGLESGDDLIIANGLNIISDGALDSALNQAFGNTAAGQSVPYLSYALAIRNFAEDPVNAIFTAAGTYAGEVIGMALGGPIGAAIGGAIGGLTRGEAVNGEFFRSVA
jgi:hypothetical protein